MGKQLCKALGEEEQQKAPKKKGPEAGMSAKALRHLEEQQIERPLEACPKLIF